MEILSFLLSHFQAWRSTYGLLPFVYTIHIFSWKQWFLGGFGQEGLKFLKISLQLNTTLVLIKFLIWTSKCRLTLNWIHLQAWTSFSPLHILCSIYCCLFFFFCQHSLVQFLDVNKLFTSGLQVLFNAASNIYTLREEKFSVREFLCSLPSHWTHKSCLSVFIILLSYWNYLSIARTIALVLLFNA